MTAMARAGAETRAVLGEFSKGVFNLAEIKGTGPTIDTTNPHKIKVGGVERGGTYCYKFAATGAENAIHAPGWFGGVKERFHFYRVGFKKVGTTGGTRVIARCYAAEGELLASVEVTSADKIILKNGAGTEVASVTNGLNEAGMTNHNGYHIFEFAIYVASTTTTCKGRFWWDNVEVHKNESTYTVQKANAPEGIRFGWITGESTAVLYADDLGVNDETGTLNGRLGVESVIGHLNPTADKGRELMTTGSGGTTELFKATDAPPEGVADGSKSATSQIYYAPSSTSAFYEATLVSYESLGVQAGDKIVLLKALAHVARVTGNVTGGISGISNPAITEVTENATATPGTYPASWNRIWTADVNEPSLTLGTAPVIKLRKAQATTNALHCCYLAMLVEWTPTEAAAGKTAMLVG